MVFGFISGKIAGEGDAHPAIMNDESVALGVAMGKIVPRHIYKACLIDRESLKKKREKDWFKYFRNNEAISKFFE
jgi:hypothetical protein